MSRAAPAPESWPAFTTWFLAYLRSRGWTGVIVLLGDRLLAPGRPEAPVAFAAVRRLRPADNDNRRRK